MKIKLTAINNILLTAGIGAAIVSCIAFAMAGSPDTTAALQIDGIYIHVVLTASVTISLLSILARATVLKPLRSICDQLTGIAAENAWGKRVEMDARIHEVGMVADSVNRLLRSAEQDVAHLTQLGTKDRLTCLPNYNGVVAVIDSEIDRCLRTGTSFSIMLLDLDNFEQVNSNFGVRSGDDAIKSIAKQLKEVLRRLDTVGRFGDDEFLVLLPMTNKKQAIYVAHKLHYALNSAPTVISERAVNLTASIGLATYPDDGIGRHTLLNEVKELVLQAKGNGKNSCAFKDAGQVSTISVNKSGYYNINEALSVENIEVALQPIVFSHDGVVMGYEVLARIRDGGGLVSATEFIKHAETNGVLRVVDAKVFEMGLAKLSEIGQGAKMFFNFSQPTMENREWMLGIPDMVEAAGVACGQVVVEFALFETVANIAELYKVIRRLKDRGILFALDNFGRGSASFQCIRDFRVDYLKIDGGIIRNVAHSQVDRDILEAVQSIATALGLKTIAERVEDEDTLAVITEAGIPFAQGFYFGPPVAQYRLAAVTDMQPEGIQAALPVAS